MARNLSSMTGFGRASGTYKDTRWTWELKSVNGRNLDLRLRLPQGMDVFEGSVRDVLSKAFSRGAIQVSLTLDRSAKSYDVRVNEELLKKILQLAGKLGSKAKLAAPSLECLLALPNVMEVVETRDDEASEKKLQAALLAGLQKAIAALRKARAAEGAILSALFISQVETIEGLTNEAEKHPSRQPEVIKKRLHEQIKPLIEEGKFDEDRLYQEALVVATRIDIREEIDRLYAHAAQLRGLLKESGAIGRRLEFLAQEFNREANTLCSKSHDAGLTAIGLSLKNVIDQLREQAQNVE